MRIAHLARVGQPNINLSVEIEDVEGDQRVGKLFPITSTSCQLQVVFWAVP